MACTHPPSLIERVSLSDGTPGIRCLACGMSAFRGESVWTGLKRWLRGKRGS